MERTTMEDIIRDETRGNVKTQKMNVILNDIIASITPNSKIADVRTLLDKAQRSHKYIFPKSYLLSYYLTKVRNNELEYNNIIHYGLIRKISKSHSGVSVITILTSAYPSYVDPISGEKKVQTFSCPNDCAYCPTEKGQPKSYLSSEPAVQRAIRNDYDPVKQFMDRGRALIRNGHIVDKVEIIVLGGTWSCYPDQYKEEFIRDTYYAANTLYSAPYPKMSLTDEMKRNETAKCRIIGLTLETRPDKINPREIEKLRTYGCTRVQIGVQHTDDDVLRYINRGCLHRHTVRAIKLLKNAGFKVDIHIMPDLPGSSLEKDREMFRKLRNDPNLQVDHEKWYPTAVTPHTKIAEWYSSGKYKPYGEKGNELFTLLAEEYLKAPEWVRINRIIRDIPTKEIIGGNKNVSMRKDLDEYLKQNNLRPREIRSREVKMSVVDPKNINIIKRRFESSGSMEYFISMEDTENDKLLGFTRLRLPIKRGKEHYLKELRGCALIRELHVYGFLNPVGGTQNHNAQHKGYGKRLLLEAEKIAKEHNYNKIAIISGNGVREYYRARGYNLEGTYMVKTLIDPPSYNCFEYLQVILMVFIILFMYICIDKIIL